MRRQKGSITVEAALFIPIFLFAFLSIYNLIYFARAQLIVQYAVNQAAKEVGEYSYLLEKMGILENVDRVSQNAQSFQKDVDSVKDNLKLIQEAAENVFDGSVSAQEIRDAGDTIKSTKDTVSTYIDSPEKFLNGVMSVLKDGAVSELSKYMIDKVARSCVEKQLSVASGGGDPEAYLEKLGVSDVEMREHSSWCRNQTRDIKIVVDFNVTNHMPFFLMAPRHYRVCASTRIWSGK